MLWPGRGVRTWSFGQDRQCLPTTNPNQNTRRNTNSNQNTNTNENTCRGADDVAEHEVASKAKEKDDTVEKGGRLPA